MTGLGQDDRDHPANCKDSITFFPVMRLKTLPIDVVKTLTQHQTESLKMLKTSMFM